MVWWFNRLEAAIYNSLNFRETLIFKVFNDNQDNDNKDNDNQDNNDNGLMVQQAGGCYL